MAGEASEGLYISRKSDFAEPYARIAQFTGFELMRIRLSPHQTVWVSPANNPDLVELYCVISGALEIWTGDQKQQHLEPGDCFYTRDLRGDVRVVAISDSELIYSTNDPVFDSVNDYTDMIHRVLEPIDAKDNITLEHSRNVMRYTVALYDRLGARGITMDDIVTASLFHDVGKCDTPDAILKKVGRLTAEEYDVMKLHPLDSYRVLLPAFGESVARIARSHHERMDGSGYPDGLSGNDICYGARLVAVTDSFEAMTHKRQYNTVKTPEAAIGELLALEGKYDREMVLAFAELVRSGAV